MNDRRPYSLLQLRELGHGIHDLPGLIRGSLVRGSEDDERKGVMLPLVSAYFRGVLSR